MKKIIINHNKNQCPTGPLIILQNNNNNNNNNNNDNNNNYYYYYYYNLTFIIITFQILAFQVALLCKRDPKIFELLKCETCDRR